MLQALIVDAERQAPWRRQMAENEYPNASVGHADRAGGERVLRHEGCALFELAASRNVAIRGFDQNAACGRFRHAPAVETASKFLNPNLPHYEPAGL